MGRPVGSRAPDAQAVGREEPILNRGYALVQLQSLRGLRSASYSASVRRLQHVEPNASYKGGNTVVKLPRYGPFPFISLGATEISGSAIVGPNGLLGGIKSAEPDSGLLQRVSNLRGEQIWWSCPYPPWRISLLAQSPPPISRTRRYLCS